MSLWHIAWSYLWNRRLPTCLTILSVALGVGLISAVHTLRNETQRRFEEEGQAFDIVVGGKGSPLQLVLSSVYFLDTPTGNISYEDYEAVKNHEDVSAAFPINLGDTYRMFRIVGTVPELFQHQWVTEFDEKGVPIPGREKKPFEIAEGRIFEKDMEAVVGSMVAEQTGLKLGDTFVGTHGFVGHVHADHPYTVVGIMKRGFSPNDRAIFCSLNSTWAVHGQHGHNHEGGHVHETGDVHEAEEAHEAGDAHEAEAAHEAGHVHGAEAAHEAGHVHEAEVAHEGGEEEELEVTAVLVSLKSPGLRFTFVDYVNRELKAMATIPVQQIKKLYDQLLGTVKVVLLTVAYLVVAVAALTVMIGLYLSILQRRRDLAIMRALGASTLDIFGAVIVEAFLVTILGVCAGWLLGNVVSWGLGLYLTKQFGMAITAFGLSTDELKSFAVVAVVGYLAGILPAWQAYRTDVVRDLTR